MRRVRIAALALGLAIGLLIAVGEPRMRAEVRIWYPDGRVQRVSPDEGTYYQACIHPDGSRVVFSGGDEGPPRVWEAELSSGRVRPLTPADSAAFLASYSWDGTRIVFSSDRDFGAESIRLEDVPDPRLYRPATVGANHREFNLYLMDADGGDARRVTRGASRDLRATFSPDGSHLAFFSTKLPLLWTIAADGSGEPAPVPIEGEERWNPYRPWFGADGEHLYFFGSTRTEPRMRIARVPIGGGVPETLAWDDQGKSQGPFVDPSGPSLLFHSNRTGRGELYELELPWSPEAEPRRLELPAGDLPADADVMHPTRASNGVVAFDVSYEDGSAPVRWLRRLRARIARRIARL